MLQRKGAIGRRKLLKYEMPGKRNAVELADTLQPPCVGLSRQLRCACQRHVPPSWNSLSLRASVEGAVSAEPSRSLFIRYPLLRPGRDLASCQPDPVVLATHPSTGLSLESSKRRTFQKIKSTHFGRFNFRGDLLETAVNSGGSCGNAQKKQGQLWLAPFSFCRTSWRPGSRAERTIAALALRRSAHDQDGHLAMEQDLGSHAAQQEARDAATPVRGHHD